MEIEYRVGFIPEPGQVIAVYTSAGLPRPTSSPERIRKMYENSNLVVTAWLGDKLVAVSRALTDFCWTCYLADLAVDNDYQNKGIGARLIELTKKEIGEETMLVLLSVPGAMNYYPRLGFVKQESCFIINRSV